MFGITNYGAFIIAGVLLNMTPGPDTMYILGRSIAQGKKAGVLSALGIASGSLVHTLAAGFGLSVLLSKSLLAFNIVKYLGAVYLVYLGTNAIRNAKRAGDISDVRNQLSGRNIFWSGVLTNILNPKVALFFLAFLPQFINPANAGSALPFLILGATFIFTGTVWCFILALFSSAIAAKLRQNSQIKIWLERVTGSLFILLGIRLAFSQK